MGQMNNPRLERERAVYRYLDALESGDIDGIVDILNQAVYDAPLDQMVAEAHQAFFQEEGSQQAELAEIETREIPALEPATSRTQRQGQKHRGGVRKAPRWAQTLAAVLIVGALLGSFLGLLAIHNQSGNVVGSGQSTPAATPGNQLPACYSWRQFDTQNNVTTSASLNSLAAVTSVSANDAWAVGSSSSAPGQTVVNSATFIEHWNGTGWSAVPSPNGSDDNSSLTAIAAVSANDVWAVGYSWPATATQSQSNSSPNRTLIEHWDGRSWRVVPSPNSAAGDGVLVSIAAVSANDIWAVGRTFYSGLIEHWNGKVWSVVSASGALVGGTFNSVTAVAANSVWVVGAVYSKGQLPRTLVAHWNGSQWQSLPVLVGTPFVLGVSALSSGDVWVTSNNTRGSSQISHWNGQQWSTMPGSVLPAITLSQVVAIAPNNIWAIESPSGGSSDNTGPHMLVLHWNGTSWQQVATPALQVPDGLSNIQTNGLAVSGGQIWVVGDANDSDGGYSASLILGQHPCS